MMFNVAVNRLVEALSPPGHWQIIFHLLLIELKKKLSIVNKHEKFSFFVDVQIAGLRARVICKSGRKLALE